MNWIEAFFQILGAAAIFVFFAFARNQSQKDVEHELNGDQLLRMHPFYKYLGLVSLFMALGLTIGLLYELYDQSISLIIGLSITWLMFGFLGIYLLMYYYRHYVRFNEQYFIVNTWLGKEVKMEWQQVTNVRFRIFMAALELKSASKKVNVHQQLTGWKSFVEMFDKKTKWNAKSLKIPI